MFMVLGKPLAAITSGLTNWLNSLTGAQSVLLGIILGLMMCFDLGGPVNKAAYAFAVAGLNVNDPASLRIMAAVMAAGMVPPLAMALASTVLRPSLFTEPERENGMAAWLLGASFISEGAIPFAAADPFRVIPSMMLGGAVTGGMIMALSAELSAPHGGIFVAFAMGGGGGILKFFISLAARGGRRRSRRGVREVVPQVEGRGIRGFGCSRERLTLSSSIKPARHQPTRGESMPSKTVKVGSSVGLHARPAAVIAEAVSDAGVAVTLAVAGGDPVDAGSALMIMTLGATVGTEVTVESDDQATLDKVVDLVEQDLDA